MNSTNKNSPLIPPPVINSEVMYKGVRLAVRKDYVDCGLKDPVLREVVEHPGAVVILPVFSDGQLLMVNQFRHPLGRMMFEFPAGTLEHGEKPDVCAHRELTEEAHFRAQSMISLGIIHPAPGFCNEQQFLFLATDLIPEKGTPDPGEIIETAYFTVSEVKKMITNCMITDAKSIAIFSRALFSGYFEQLQ
ncbi:MAG TPA: NUDIX hydrolase [Oligoflexia bacterium]|nr:NUDIX hydrolase [Oligoflexia bacterium]HMP49328.1 NUDIX hydrolase [Oligoflexia bacterium]